MPASDDGLLAKLRRPLRSDSGERSPIGSGSPLDAIGGARLGVSDGTRLTLHHDGIEHEFVVVVGADGAVSVRPDGDTEGER